MEYLKITLAEIQTFIETYQKKSFSDAAKALYVSRQSVARNIEHIEDVIGVPLFIRTSSGIEPTEYGVEFEKRCLIVVQDTQNLLNFMEDMKKSYNHELNFGLIGFSNSTRKALKVLEKFRSQNPDIAVNVQNLEGGPFREMAREKKTDFSFVNLDIEEQAEDIQQITLEEQEFLLLVNGDDPIAELPEVPVEKLNGRNIVLLTKLNIPGRILTKIMDQAGVKPNSVVLTSDINVVRSSVEEEGYISFLMNPTAGMLLQGDSNISSTHLAPRMMRHSGLLYSSDMTITDAHRRFIEFFKAEYDAK